MTKLKDKIKKFPKSSGVYFFIDKNKHILYVGRATSLKNRVSQYFQKNIDIRIAEMVSLAYDIKYIETDNLLEAIILEAKNIKKYWPKYNIKDKDNRSFIYIAIDKNSDFPKVKLIRERELHKFPVNKFAVFGPYQSLYLIQNALKIIRRIFPYSTCVPNNGKPCFDYQIGLCPGTCISEISKKDYKKNISNIILFLSGEKKRLLKKLMEESPEKAKFLKHIQDVSLLTNEDDINEKINRIEGYDISHFGGHESYGSMVVFENGEANKNEYRLFKIKTAPAGDDERALEEVISRRLNHNEWQRPDLIMIDGGKPQVDYISKLFRKININIPIVGISKYDNDRLVYGTGMSKSIKDLCENIKPTLLKTREEAHRFANRGRKRSFGKRR
ncbi:MAG: GIY-YIG nuclease family protein [Patescibacteria group bacterium]|nr:GIY-YIG nuclease family protein [Patescibacteria group bacterium]MDD4304227.1 GIY-YIG nuclease family protein [Patescibacteria group bacterium]MDD4695281.1 GIY-YIG nuclease family protein [Patescibacteria group bacterium]